MFVLEIKAGRVLSHSDQSAQSDAALVNGSALVGGNRGEERAKQREGGGSRNAVLVKLLSGEMAARWWGGWNSPPGSLCMQPEILDTHQK